MLGSILEPLLCNNLHLEVSATHRGTLNKRRGAKPFFCLHLRGSRRASVQKLCELRSIILVSSQRDLNPI